MWALVVLAVSQHFPGSCIDSTMQLVAHAPPSPDEPLVVSGYLCTDQGKKFAVVRVVNRGTDPIFVSLGDATITDDVGVSSSKVITLYVPVCDERYMTLILPKSEAFKIFSLKNLDFDTVEISFRMGVYGQSPICRGHSKASVVDLRYRWPIEVKE